MENELKPAPEMTLDERYALFAQEHPDLVKLTDKQEELKRKQEQRKLERMIRAKKIILLRLEQKKTLEEIGNSEKVTRERIRQILKANGIIWKIQ